MSEREHEIVIAVGIRWILYVQRLIRLVFDSVLGSFMMWAAPAWQASLPAVRATKLLIRLTGRGIAIGAGTIEIAARALRQVAESVAESEQ